MNICGLYEWKLADDVVGAHLKKYDIILLQETWSAEGDVFYLNGYKYYNFPRKHRHKLSMCNSCVKYTGDISAWLKLERSFYLLAADLYAGNMYVVPEISVYLCHDVFNRKFQDYVYMKWEHWSTM